MTTGAETVLAQIAAEVLACPVDDVIVYAADTDLVMEANPAEVRVEGQIDDGVHMALGGITQKCRGINIKVEGGWIFLM